jgi:hypothetical protein
MRALKSRPPLDEAAFDSYDCFTNAENSDRIWPPSLPLSNVHNASSQGQQVGDAQQFQSTWDAFQDLDDEAAVPVYLGKFGNY